LLAIFPTPIPAHPQWVDPGPFFAIFFAKMWSTSRVVRENGTFPKRAGGKWRKVVKYASKLTKMARNGPLQMENGRKFLQATNPKRIKGPLSGSSTS
jgi:hypothetical protein